jgi:hypothetical protein
MVLKIMIKIKQVLKLRMNALIYINQCIDIAKK